MSVPPAGLRKFALAAIATVGLIALLEYTLELWVGVAYLRTGSSLIYKGVLVEVPSIVWFMVLLGIERAALRVVDPAQSQRLNTYVFLWCVLGLAGGVFAFKHARPDNLVNWSYWIALAAVAASFCIAGTRTLAGVLDTVRHLPRDLAAAASWGGTWALGLIVAVLIVAGPTADSTAPPRKPPPRGADLIAWFDAQSRTALPREYLGAPVTVLTFNDYQCPGCFSAEHALKPLWTELSDRFGDRVAFRRLDFPLDDECNEGPEVPSIHPMACEAAVVMRLAARSADTRDLMMVERWIWSNQGTMDRRTLFQAARELAGAFDVEQQYERTLAEVHAEAAVGRTIGVRATPTFWINGVKISMKPPEDLRLIILHELTRVGVVDVGRETTELPARRSAEAR